MSIEAMNYAYQQTVGSISKKAVLVTLANMADHNGECFPSIQYIADRTEMTTRSAKRCLADLAADGHLTITERMGKTGQRSNLYVIDCSGVTIKQGVTLTTDKRTQCPGGGDIDDKKVDTVSPITISNNQYNNHSNKTDSKESAISEVRQSKFDEWWEAYDKKVSRKKAESAWKNLKWSKIGKEPDDLIADTKLRLEGDNSWPKYQPNPLTYLNGERWNDVIKTNGVANNQSSDADYYLRGAK